MVAPFLRSLENSDQSNSEKAPAERINISDSIREHFDKLTEMTPTKPVAKEEEPEEEKEDGALETSEDEELVEPKSKKPYFEESQGRVKSLRVESKQRNNKKKNKRKQRRQEDGDHQERSERTEVKQEQFDYGQVNFKSFGGKQVQTGRDFNPSQSVSEKENKKGGKKKQQFQKRGNKSFTFKKSS